MLKFSKYRQREKPKVGRKINLFVSYSPNITYIVNVVSVSFEMVEMPRKGVELAS